jgi:hypothetical protein
MGLGSEASTVATGHGDLGRGYGNGYGHILNELCSAYEAGLHEREMHKGEAI